LVLHKAKQQGVRAYMGLLELADKHSPKRLDAACQRALSLPVSPSYKTVKKILDTGQDKLDPEGQNDPQHLCLYTRRQSLCEEEIIGNATYEKLRSMRLGAMAEAYKQQLSDPEMCSLSFEERMALLTDIEWTRRRNNCLKRLIANAKFYQPQAHLGDIHFSPRPELNRDQILMLRSCSYITDARNLVIIGAATSGKSFIGCALGIEAFKQSYFGRFVRIPALMENLNLLLEQECCRRPTKTNPRSICSFWAIRCS